MAIPMEVEPVVRMQSASVERRRVAHVDLDDTLTRGLILEPLVSDQLREGIISLSSPDLTRLMTEIKGYKHGRKGQPSNIMGLNLYWARLCEGIPYVDLLDHATRFIRQNKNQFAPYAPYVFDIFNEKDYDSWVDTGEPSFVADAVVKEFGATGRCSTNWRTEWRKGNLVVCGVELPMTSKQKGEWAEKLFTDEENRAGNTREHSICLVDSANDIALTTAVEYSVVCGTPSPVLLDHLKATGRNYSVPRPEEVIHVVDKLTSFDNPRPPRKYRFISIPRGESFIVKKQKLKAV